MDITHATTNSTTPKPRRSSLHAAAARLSAIGTALLLVVFLVMSVSRAAFTATTSNNANSAATGTIALTDNDAGTAMFNNVTGLVALDTVTRCITVDYTGSINPTAVQLYAAGAPTGTLATYLDFVVEIGAATADPFSACTGFTPTSTLFSNTLANFASTHSSYANGLSTWDPAGTESRTFRFTITVQDNSLAAGLTAGWGLTWETRSA